MPKKKKGKETTTEFRFDYRYTPKPYFTAPNGSPSSATGTGGTPLSSSSTPSSSGSSLSGTPNQARNYGRPHAWQRACSTTWVPQPPSSYVTPKGTPNRPPNKTSSHQKLGASAASDVELETNGTASEPSEKDKANIKRMFEEMFRGRVESSVIEMVLQEEQYNGECGQIVTDSFQA